MNIRSLIHMRHGGWIAVATAAALYAASAAQATPDPNGAGGNVQLPVQLVTAEGGFDWGDAFIGASVATALLVALAAALAIRKIRRTRVLATAAVSGALVILATVLAGGGVASPPDDLQALKAATARYHSFTQAERDGYTIAGEPCVESPLGAMGIHAINPALIDDRAIDPMRPEILLYVPDENGRLELVGVEYLTFDADGDLSTDDDRPSLFGQPFDGPMEGHTPTMPVHYDLHVWVWAKNTSGLFAMFNPSLSC